jgi:hypothetical protein
MYRQDITQSVEPAMANPERMASAIRAQGEATKATIGALGTAYETKQFMDMRQLQVDSEYLTNQFMAEGVAAEQAGRTLPVLEDVISFDQNVGPLRDEDFAVINNMKSEANRLRSALEGGMSNVQYEARVADLTRKYLARYPGMGDKIRQIVGAATGLPGADRWAASQYVQERFSPKKPDANSDAMIKKDIDLIMGSLPNKFSYEELYTMRATNDPRYYGVLRQAQERVGIKANNENARNMLENVGFANVPEMQEASLAAFEGEISTQLTGAYDLAVAQGTFDAYNKMVQSGKMNPDELAAAAQAHSARMLRSVDVAYTNAKNNVLRKAAALGLTKAQQEEVLAGLSARYESEKLLWGDKNAFVAQALVEKGFADATLDKKLRMLQATSNLLQHVDSSVINSYFTNPQVLKASNLELYNFIDTAIQAANNARTSVISSLDTTRNNIRFTVQQAEKTGELVIPEGSSTQEIKTIHQNISANVASAINVINSTPEAQRGEVTPNAVRNLQALLTGVTPQGGGVDVTRSIGSLRSMYEKLPDSDKQTIKAAASTGSVSTMNNIKAVMLDIEREFGVKPQIGVNDAGELGFVNFNIKGVTQARPGGSQGTLSDIANFNASKEAVKRLTPMLTNLVNTRVFTESGDATEVRKTVANEYANIINNNQPYRGFFSLEARPAQEAASPTRTNTTATMADVVEFATQEGMSIEEAESQLRASGITID